MRTEIEQMQRTFQHSAALAAQGVQLDVLDDQTMVMNMGPQHPSTHGVLRVVLELDGEIIVRATPHVGYVHTGIEKTIEYNSYLKAVPLTDRIDYVSALINNAAYSLAVEKLLGIEIPPRGQALRVMLMELQRLASHLVWLGTHALDIGAMTVYFYAFQQREYILDLVEMISGVRMMPSWIVPGGLRGDAPDGWLERAADFINQFPSALKEMEDLLSANPIYRERTQGIGVISAEECLALGVSGPTLRACGIAHDVRKAEPYCGYEHYTFYVPTAEFGDVYDRYRVRIAEMYQSREIVKQCIENMPPGPINSDDRKVVPPPRQELDNSMEGVIHHFKLWTEGFHPPVGEAYVPLESPKGEIGFYIVSDGSNCPYRAHLRPPCFMNLQALSKMCEGRLIADVVAIIGSIDIILGEIDR
ncbi:NADH dehydrogenase subunit D [Chthonomonas calidirosea]|uniref:NADH-quinone oxidoreductase subunit D n=1 Tax=Chthonomonas calidirosea (strain DSM 23976 / ICMP 18418 / T49) TaxID=1303518 RepID=S0EV21_CHTCT|nr:NADH dehydrogenase (quinone) subunit D [Chthonomonas calidirosea]CCW35588.1 NADH dehydrogenase subunit D [Chthonomonas calidirosea T49]CEK19823.1 NADH dehydrogenase subunit D [Chthonomonas calidirosea]